MTFEFGLQVEGGLRWRVQQQHVQAPWFDILRVVACHVQTFAPKLNPSSDLCGPTLPHVLPPAVERVSGTVVGEARIAAPETHKEA